MKSIKREKWKGTEKKSNGKCEACTVKWFNDALLWFYSEID